MVHLYVYFITLLMEFYCTEGCAQDISGSTQKKLVSIIWQREGKVGVRDK